MAGENVKIAAIGSFQDRDNIENIKFGDDVSFLDYDMIVLDLTYVLNDYQAVDSNIKTHQGYKLLNDDDSEKITQDINRRKYEISEMLKLGRPIILFTPKDIKCYIQKLNKITHEKYHLVSLLSTLPIEVSVVNSYGNNISFIGDEIFSSYWSINKKHLCYDAYFNEPMGKSIFVIKGTDKVIGSWTVIENGLFLILPAYYDENSDRDSEREFFESLINITNELKRQLGDYTLPEWSGKYLLPFEDKKRRELKELEKKKEALERKNKETNEVYLELIKNKILFTGTGKVLEKKVEQIFSDIGFEVIEPLPNRDDLILKYKDKIAVVEIKGVTKSAAEKHATQLEKWISNYFEENSTMPKGILVVNSYKDIPLKDRIEDTFPVQMLDYSNRRGHCLITGVQLLGLYLKFFENKDNKDDLINSLFDTIGLYEGFKDWSNYIKFNN